MSTRRKISGSTATIFWGPVDGGDTRALAGVAEGEDRQGEKGGKGEGGEGV